MDRTERETLIESYGNAYNILLEALKQLPGNMWLWRPAEGKWSVHEVVIHIADSEANSYIRLRRLLAETGSGVYGYDENAWAQKLNYHHQNIEDALQLFKWLRHNSYTLLKTVSEETWQTAFVNHSESGVLSLEKWLVVYNDHIPVHIKQMQRNLHAFKQQQQG